jgi:hypothetical protein
MDKKLESDCKNNQINNKTHKWRNTRIKTENPI